MPLTAAQLGYRKSNALYRGFVGGRGAGKTFIGAYDLIQRALPGRTYLVASPTGILMQDTTFPTFKEIVRRVICMGPAVRLTPYPNIELPNGAIIRFRTAEDAEKLRGPNLSGVWLDEASLMTAGVYDIAIACLREGGEQGWLSATFTPKGVAHWTYDIFGKARPDTELFHSTTADNPFNPPEFAATLARQYGDTPFARQELEGEWLDSDDAWQVIPTSWVIAAQKRQPPEPSEPLTCVGVDVAHGGADATVSVHRSGVVFRLAGKWQGPQTDSGQKAADLVLRDYPPDSRATIHVDAIGYGASCAERLKDALGDRVLAVDVARATQHRDGSGQFRLFNVRAAMYWTLREALDPVTGDGLVLPPGPEVLADLTAPRYEVRANGIVIEAKEEIKKRLGRSPDVGDALALSHWNSGPPMRIMALSPEKPRPGQVQDVTPEPPTTEEEEDRDIMSPLKFPMIRAFPQSGQFQMTPEIDGRKHYGPEFHTQSEAAYGIIFLHRLLNLGRVAFEVTKIDDEKKKAVEESVRKWVAEKKLEPKAPPEPEPARKK